jgi:hypothetical protein
MEKMTIEKAREISEKIVNKVEVARLNDTVYLGVENLKDEINEALLKYSKRLDNFILDLTIYTDKIILEYKSYVVNDKKLEPQSKKIRIRTANELLRRIENWRK